MGRCWREQMMAVLGGCLEVFQHRSSLMSSCPSAILSGQRVAVVGASLGGLAAANVLSFLGAVVTVFEKHDENFALKGGGLGADLDVLQDIRQSDAAPLRLRDGGPGTYFYGDLWKYLHDGLAPGTVRFGTEVSALADGNVSCPSLMVDGVRQEYHMLVAADGGWSNMRSKYVEPGPQPVYAGYVLFRGLVDTAHLPGFNHWGFHGRGQVVTGGYKVRGPQNEAIANVGLYIAVPSDAAAAAEPGKRFEGRQIASARHTQPAWFIPLVRRLFGSEWARLWSAVASHGKFSPHPVYEHGARAAVAGRVLLLGDAAHMASPNTGSGARAAFADALALRHCLVQSFAAGGGGDASAKIDAALQAYNKDVVERGKQLLQLSQHVGHRYMPGTQEMLLVESLAKEAAREVAPSSD